MINHKPEMLENLKQMYRLNGRNGRGGHVGLPSAANLRSAWYIAAWGRPRLTAVDGPIDVERYGAQVTSTPKGFSGSWHQC